MQVESHRVPDFPERPPRSAPYLKISSPLPHQLDATVKALFVFVQQDCGADERCRVHVVTASMTLPSNSDANFRRILPQGGIHVAAKKYRFPQASPSITLKFPINDSFL